MRSVVDWVRRERHGKREVLRAATGLSESERSDEDALAALKPVVGRRPYGARRTIELVRGLGRESYQDDRAYRLLAAAIHGKPVEPMPADSRELFERERWLGHQPLAEAFSYLADREPRLRQLADEARANPQADPGTSGVRGRAVPLPFGMGEGDELCESNLARSVANQYLQLLSGIRDADPTVSYFALRGKIAIRAVRVGWRKPAPDVTPG